MSKHFKTIVLFGKNGQLGRSFEDLRSKIEEEFILYSFDRGQADITDIKALENIKKEYSPDFIINCAAYTQVDKAESDVSNANLVNTNAVENIAKIFGDNAFIIHYSTDYVYGIESFFPLNEVETCRPINQYAKSKWEGEKGLQKHCDQYIIIRTSWVYSQYGNNFVKTMLKLGKERRSLSIVNDQLGSPTYAMDLANSTIEILLKLKLHTDPKSLTGVYNYANEGTISWYDFAKYIFELKEIDIDLKGIPSSDYPTPAKRPFWSKMQLNKIKQTFDIEIPHWLESLKKCLKKID